MKIKDIIETIEQFAPLEWQDSWDNCGLQVGSREDDCTGAVLCLDVTLEALERAIEKGYNLIISHHPLIMQPLRTIDAHGSVQQEIIYRAIANRISIYSAHTNIDNAPHGLSYLMGQRLGLSQTGVLVENPAYKGVGTGFVGEYQGDGKSFTEFVELLKSEFSMPIVRHSRRVNARVKKVALCSGSGFSFFDYAISSGADCYLTSDIKYHQFQQATSLINLIEIGHFESEIESLILFCEIIRKKFYTFAFDFIDSKDSNFVFYK